MPRPFRMTRSGVLRTLLALRAMPMAPSAAAKDSWPARKAKHLVSSSQQHRAQVAVAETNLALVSDGAGDAEGLQAHRRCASAASAAVFTPFFRAMAAPSV